MSYKDLPVLPLDIVRGNSKEVILQDITVNDVGLDLTASCVKIQFKSQVDSLRYIDFELNETNGGLVVTSTSVILKFGRETSRLAISRYYGDMLLKIDGKDVTILRFEMNLTGAVTTKKESDEC